MIRPCERCGRATRPVGRSAADHPGTIVRATGGLCMTCYGRDYRQGHAHPRPLKPSVSPTCVRCGYVRPHSGGNTSPLCRDCRSVMSAAEREAWAA